MRLLGVQGERMTVPILISRISAVTVFTSGALVTRAADLASLSARPERVRMTGLPLCLDDASLRVRIEGGAAIAGDLAIALEPADADVSLPPPEDAALLSALRSEARARVGLELCENRLSQLENLVIPERPRAVRGSPPPSSPTGARLALLAFRRAESERLILERERLREELRLESERLADLVAKAELASSARQSREHQLRKSAVVSLRWPAGAPAAGMLLIDYLVPGARWAPSYTIRFDRAMAAASIQVRGSVVQRSGENWDAVKLTLSTADAMAWHELPELASLRIGRRQPSPRKPGWREPPRGADSLYADFDAAIAREMPRQQSEKLESGERMKVGGFGAAKPKPAKKSAPMPQPSLGSVASYRDAPAPPPAPAPAPARSAAPAGAMAKSRRARADLDKDDDAVSNSASIIAESRAGYAGGEKAEHEESAPAPMEADRPADRPADDLLAYRRLRLAPPEHGGRGRLTPLSASDAYAAVITEQRIVITIEVEQVVAMAMATANEAEYVALPQGCRIPSTPQFAYAYPVEAPASVPSDGAWHAVPLGERPAPTKLEHVVVPRESREVFRVAQLANPFEVPLLDGPADVYAAEDYLMTAEVGVTVPGGSLALGLGVEQGVSVARNTSYEEESAGMLGGSLALTHRIAISIANKLRAPVALEVRERLPVPTPGVDDCKIKVVQVAPAWEDYRQEGQHLDGGHRWRVQLAAGAAQELTAVYTVVIPSKSEIAGGNRREE